jgi:hypothetical protein
LFPTANISEMVPWKLLSCRFRTERESHKLPKHCGSKPVKLLLDKSGTTIELRLQINCGISPVNVLFETEYQLIVGGGIGSDP